MSGFSNFINKIGLFMTAGGSIMAALLQHFNNNAAAYSVLIGFLGLGVTGAYHIVRICREGKEHKWKAEEHAAKMSMARRGMLQSGDD
jgi:hypothetical protein